MASILPDKDLDRIAFFENHNPTWSTNAVAIGTTAAEVTALTTKTTAARAAYNAQQLAQTQAKAATAAYHAAVTAMVGAGNDIIKEIKAKAAIVGDSVYSLALIPAPSTPTPIGPPGPATDFTATLDPTGILTLAWKCANPAGASGTVYQVARQIGATGPLVIIGAAGERKFTDPSVPAGSAQVTYQITGIRSTVAGPARQFTVKFGAVGGEMVASVVAAPLAPKLAA